MISKIILPHNFKVEYTCDYLVGVDYGAFQLASKGIMMDLSIGDFDSVDEDEMKLIKRFSKECITLSVDKNETDSEAALMHVSNLGMYDIEMISDLGNRFDHLLNNFRLLNKYKFTLKTKDSEIFMLSKGTTIIHNTHEVLSLFANGEALIDLKGTLYELSNHHFNENDTYLTSNKITADKATINVIKGSVIVVLSND